MSANFKPKTDFALVVLVGIWAVIVLVVLAVGVVGIRR